MHTSESFIIQPQSLQDQFQQAVMDRNIEALKTCLDLRSIYPHSLDINKHYFELHISSKIIKITALSYASFKNHVDTVQALLQVRADINIADNMGTPLVWASMQGHTEIVQILLAAGANVNKANARGLTSLIAASMKGRTDTVQVLLNHGADINEVDIQGHTALITATLEGHTEIVKALIGAGVAVNKADNESMTALMHAAWRGYIEIVKALIGSGADDNKFDDNYTTALMGSAIQGHAEMVKALIAAGVAVNKANIAGETALMFAEMRGHDEIIAAINNFKTDHPTIIAIQDKKMSILGITEEHAQEKTEAGYTTLMAACASDDLALAKKLLEYGADIYAQDTYGRTALSCARSTTMIMDCIKNRKLDIPAALGSIHSAHTILECAVQQDNRDLIELILHNVPKLVERSSNVLSLSNDIAVIRLLSRYGISPPRNIVLQPHIQQEVIIQHILASTPWSYAQRLTMTVGDVKAWMRDYADMLPKETDNASIIDQKTMKEIHKCEDDTIRAMKFLKKDDHLLYTVYCAKVVGKMKECEMSPYTKTLVNLIESKMCIEHGYAKQALDRLSAAPKIIDVYAASYRIELEEALLPLMTYDVSSYDERLLEFLRRFMQAHITKAPNKSEDYQALLALTDEITTVTSDDLDKSIKELIAKAQAFGEDKEGVESVFTECLLKYVEGRIKTLLTEESAEGTCDVIPKNSSHTSLFSGTSKTQGDCVSKNVAAVTIPRGI